MLNSFERLVGWRYTRGPRRVDGRDGFISFIAVLAVMGDKDVDQMLASLAQITDEVVVTVNGSPRCLPSAELAERARRYLGTVHEVRDFFAPYEEFAGLAGTYALRARS